MDVYTPIDLHQNPINEFIFQVGNAFPTTPAIGQPFVLQPLNSQFTWNGVKWVSADPSTSSFAETIGDGVTLTYPVTHGLGTLDTVESVYNTLTGLEVLCAIAHTSTEITTFIFSIPPALNSVRVVIKA